MILSIDTDSATPVYRQIVDGLRIALVNGELAPGDSLPPVRRLALDLGVHFNTVAEAYRELAREGWLDIGARSGARVMKRSVPDAPTRDVDARFRRRVEELIAEMQAQGIKRSRLASQLRRIADALDGG